MSPKYTLGCLALSLCLKVDAYEQIVVKVIDYVENKTLGGVRLKGNDLVVMLGCSELILLINTYINICLELQL